MSKMPNGYFLVDTNSLVYAYRAGGTQLLDVYFKYAEKQKRELAITNTVADEIDKGPLKHPLGRYIADRKIPVREAPIIEQQLEAGQTPRKNAGERSLLEFAAREHAEGRNTRIWGDDKFFKDAQIMRKALGVQTVQTSELLDEMHRQGFLTEAEYRRAQVRYQAVSEFQPASRSYSQRLTTFDGPAPGVLDHLGVADARIAARPGFQTLVKGAGIAGAGAMAYDAATTTQQYNALTARGNQFGADALLHNYVGHTAGGVLGGAETGPGVLVTDLGRRHHGALGATLRSISMTY